MSSGITIEGGEGELVREFADAIVRILQEDQDQQTLQTALEVLGANAAPHHITISNAHVEGVGDRVVP